jgi:RNA 3'-terminal phosphate cyclase
VIVIDGSQGEGGGQILRSALSLSICTAQRARRSFDFANNRAAAAPSTKNTAKLHAS